ncbi:hypothetical protein F5887DRAFT_469341 [Amanita rubescens]|nr:hypothetical protein F5887DRAFT_469341 [Amanita rubescens]
MPGPLLARHHRPDDGPRTTIKPLPCAPSFPNPALLLRTNPSVLLAPASAAHTPLPTPLYIRHHPLVLFLGSPQLVRPPRHAKTLRSSHWTTPRPTESLEMVDRFVRNECRPNTFLRIFLYPRSQQDALDQRRTETKKKKKCCPIFPKPY